MSRNQPESAFNPARALQKFALSAFVVLTFAVYAIHEHFTNADAGTSDPAATTQGDAAHVQTGVCGTKNRANACSKIEWTIQRWHVYRAGN